MLLYHYLTFPSENPYLFHENKKKEVTITYQNKYFLFFIYFPKKENTAVIIFHAQVSTKAYDWLN